MEPKLLVVRASAVHGPFRRRRWLRWLFSVFVLVWITALWLERSPAPDSDPRLSPTRQRDLARCKSLKVTPGPPDDFPLRVKSNRFVEGTPAVVLKNVTLWTGRDDGKQVLNGTTIVLKNGVVREIGPNAAVPIGALINDLKGAWVTPGIVDMHSHLGDSPSPYLSGTAADDNSRKGPILPWLRSIDGLNTHDDAYELSIAGGVTTSLVLPGSANAIGGEAFPIKLRHTEERTPTSKLIDVPDTLENSTRPTESKKPVWRHMKHACGENPGRVYAGSRMDTYWAFREAYETARKHMVEQDQFCSKLESSIVEDEASFPEDLQWESLVDVLRGRVKIHTHCYETVDLDAMIRISNEFRFRIAAFHHAHEAFLVPELLKKAWGGPPAIAMFATNARYKREAYRGSEFAPKILAERGISVVMKSDHPVLDSRYLLYEAQQAHHYGLPAHLALSSVTTTPAKVLGLDHRIGLIQEGHDADVVIWDSHPLSLGATPLQVYIDGIPQLKSPTTNLKPSPFQTAPTTPDYSKEAGLAIEFDGLPPLTKRSSATVLFTNVSRAWKKRAGRVVEILGGFQSNSSVLVEGGRISCLGLSCEKSLREPFEILDLQGGSIGPALVTYGPNVGLEEIEAEHSTNDGHVPDPLSGPIPDILGGSGIIVRAVDGLQFGGRDLWLAYAAGVTTGVVAPAHRGFLSGLGTAFSLSAVNRLEVGAIKQDITAVHVSIHRDSTTSVSTQIATLRRLLLGDSFGESGRWFKSVATGNAPLVIGVDSADIIATLISLKKEVENTVGSKIKFTLSGAAEAHLLAKELREADVGVILRPSRPFPFQWESQRLMPGPPLSNETAIYHLLANNVTVGLGVLELWSCRNTRFDAAWAAIDSRGKITENAALEMVSVNLERLLGVRENSNDLVATAKSSLLSFSSKVAAVVHADRGVVDIF